MPRSTTKNRLLDLTEEQLTCRDLKHAWEYGPYFRGGPVGSVDRLLTCARCKSQRRDRFFRDGSKRSYYNHSEGYMLAQPLGRNYHREVRKEVLRRVKDIFESLDMVGV